MHSAQQGHDYFPEVKEADIPNPGDAQGSHTGVYQTVPLSVAPFRKARPLQKIEVTKVFLCVKEN